jgi:outer membrane lipoprotein-sorting protein
MRYALPLLLTICAAALAQSTTQPAEVDPALWETMTRIDARSAAIKDMVADFEQSKFTPLLKKPMISKGVVRVGPSSMLWDTSSPSPSVMRIDQNEASIYYPQEKLMEIYPVGGQLGALAASPLPQLKVLKQHFSFARDNEGSDTLHLALLLTPTDPMVREHVARIRVLLDMERGFMIRFEMTDPDGERTLMSFSNVRVNTGLDESQLKIRVPPDVKVVRPLEKFIPAGTQPGTRAAP